MPNLTKEFLDFTGVSAYDTLVKAWSNSASQVAYKSVLKSADGNSLYFYLKPAATLSDTPDATISLGNADTETKLNALASIIPATYDETNHVYAITGLTTTAKNTVVAAINELKTALDLLNDADDVVGSVANSILTAINALDVPEFALTEDTNDVIKLYGIKEEDGLIAKGSSYITFAKVAKTGAAADVSVDTTNLVSYGFTDTDVQSLVESIAQAIAETGDDSKVTVETTEPSTGNILKTYSFYQGVRQSDDSATKASKLITTVNIPRDFLVKSAAVRVVETADVPYEGAEVGDRYIDFVINTRDSAAVSDEHIYIPVDELMSAISGSVGAEITVVVDSHNVISATINDVDAAKITYIAEDQTQSIARESVKAALTRLDGADTVVGSVSKKIKDAIDSLDASATIATYDSTTTSITLKAGLTETDGTIANNLDEDIVISPIPTATINSLFA